MPVLFEPATTTNCSALNFAHIGAGTRNCILGVQTMLYFNRKMCLNSELQEALDIYKPHPAGKEEERRNRQSHVMRPQIKLLASHA